MTFKNYFAAAACLDFGLVESLDILFSLSGFSFFFLSFYFIICIFKSNAICRPLELQSFVCCLLECESESPNYFINGWDLQLSPSAVTRIQVGGNCIIPASGGLSFHFRRRRLGRPRRLRRRRGGRHLVCVALRRQRGWNVGGGKWESSQSFFPLPKAWLDCRGRKIRK